MPRLLAALALVGALAGCGSRPDGMSLLKCHEARAAGISLPARYISHDSAAGLEGPWPAFERPCTP